MEKTIHEIRAQAVVQRAELEARKAEAKTLKRKLKGEKKAAESDVVEGAHVVGLLRVQDESARVGQTGLEVETASI